MAKAIGRLGYLGLGIESTPGSAAASTVYLPYTDISMRGHHTPLQVIGSKASRIQDTDSVVGKRWSEGDVKIDLDVVNSGYLWKLALGNEVLATGTPNVHTFYTSISGNTPKTATMIFGRDTDVQQYLYEAVNDLTLSVATGVATLSAAFQGKYPTDIAAATPTTTSGTVFSFKDMAIGFGNNLTAAIAATPTPVNDFSLTIANNLDVIHQSGSADVAAIRNKQLEIKGTYTLFFESTADRDAYYALNKRAMYVVFTGNANETLKIRIPQFRVSEGAITTGLSDFFVIKCSFEAEDEIDTGTGTRLIDVVLSNSLGTVYA